MSIFFTIALMLVISIALKLSEKAKFVQVISPIALAYAAGIGLSFVAIPVNEEALVQTTEISIALSICLLVLSSNLETATSCT